MLIGVTVTTPTLAKDLEVTFDDDERGEDLIAAIRVGVGNPQIESLRLERTGATIAASGRLGDYGLLHGDLLDARTDEPNHPSARLIRMAEIGPERVDVPAGGLRVGRAPQINDLVLDDDTVSKAHATLAIAGARVVIEDLGSTNRTHVNGERVDGPHVLSDKDVIRFGDRTEFQVQIASRSSASAGPTWVRLGDHLQRSSGRLYISRSWRQVRPRPVQTFTIEAAPDPVPSRKFPLPMVVLPVLVGVAGVFLFDSVNFLLFAALGPLMAAWNWYDGRRAGATQFAESRAAYLARLDDVSEKAGRARGDLSAWLDWAFPTTRELCDRGRALDPQLWDRHLSHPDVLDVRVGRGHASAENRVQISERGAPELVQRAVALREEHRVDADVPVPLRLSQCSVASLVGSSREAEGLARSILVQLAVRNSPNDVRFAVIGGDWSWARWLPHFAVESAPPLIGSDAASGARVLDAVEDRIAAARQGAVGDDRLVLVVQPPVTLPAARINAVLRSAMSAGITVVWIADASGPPPESQVVVTVSGQPSMQAGESEPIHLTSIEDVDEGTAAAVARSLAPVVDPGTSIEGAIPDRVGLLDVIPLNPVSPDAVLGRWRRPYEDRLFAPFAVGKSGVLTLDLSERGDGPNGLVGGTVGAGKSEFLQTLVLSLAANYGPDRLNFLFVDFKGGATFEPLLPLPHVVGMIRNLDGDLAMRAQRSLRAEVRRRQALLPERGVGKMSELWERDPNLAEPALVVIIDEYAELAQNLPEFLDAVVQMAQTGRALGIHLLLATQAPGQSVSKLIQNCVKYRIAFRLKDRSESMEVLDRKADASTLPNRPGRGYFVDGDDKLHEFQAAWAGARSGAGDLRASAVTLHGVRRSDVDEGPSDLVVVRAAIVTAGSEGGYPPPRRPWYDPLPAAIALTTLVRAHDQPAARPVPIGLVDLPEQQSQPQFNWDLAVNSNLLAVGDARTGKTSLLRTIAAATADDGLVEVVAIDAAGGGLGSIDGLPHVRGVVPAHDVAQLRRGIAHLQREAIRRREALGRAGSLREARALGACEIPDLVVLIDGLSILFDSLETVDGQVPLDALKRLIVEGAPLGIHFAMATDQPHRVPMDVRNAARLRLVFRLASRDAASAAEVNRVVSTLPEGRAFAPSEGGDVQVAVVADRSAVDGPAQAVALERLAVNVTNDGRVAVARLPTPLSEVRPQDVPSSQGPREVVLGLDDLGWEPVKLDFAHTPTLAVAGLDNSGRTTVIRWIRESLSTAAPAPQSIYVAGRGAPSDASRWTHVFTDLEAGLDTIESYAAQIAETGSTPEPLLIAFDDADDLFVNPIGLQPDEVQMLKRLSGAMDIFVKAGRSAGVALVLAGRLSGIGSGAKWASVFRQNGQALLLSPASLEGGGVDPVFQVPLPRRTGYRPTPGSAVLVQRGTPPTVVQLVNL